MPEQQFSLFSLCTALPTMGDVLEELTLMAEEYAADGDKANASSCRRAYHHIAIWRNDEEARRKYIPEIMKLVKTVRVNGFAERISELLETIVSPGRQITRVDADRMCLPSTSRANTYQFASETACTCEHGQMGDRNILCWHMMTVKAVGRTCARRKMREEKAYETEATQQPAD